MMQFIADLNFSEIYISVCQHTNNYQCRIYIVTFWTRPLSVQFFYFHAVFGENWQNSNLHLSSGSSGRVRRGAEKHEIYVATFGGHRFNDLFSQAPPRIRYCSSFPLGSPSSVPDYSGMLKFIMIEITTRRSRQ